MSNTHILFPTPLRGAKTDEGYVRKPNEDSHDLFKVGAGRWTEAADGDIYVAVVADGVTSKAGGAKASELAIETIKGVLRSQNLRADDPNALFVAINGAIEQANRRILEVARQNPQWGNMSTTLVMATMANGQLQVAHLGDSRAYLIRGDKIHRLTLDHTWAQEALDHARITEEQLEKNPNRNVIRRFLGINQSIDIDRQIVLPGTYDLGVDSRQTATALDVQPDDVVLLCSDGLTDKVTEDEIVRLVKSDRGRPQQAADRLVKLALSKKEQDNITVALLSLAKAQAGFGVVKSLTWAVAALLVALMVWAGIVISTGDELPSAATAVAIAPAADTATPEPSATPPAATATAEIAPTELLAAAEITATVEATVTTEVEVTVAAGTANETPVLTGTDVVEETPSVAAVALLDSSPTTPVTSVVPSRSISSTAGFVESATSTPAPSPTRKPTPTASPTSTPTPVPTATTTPRPTSAASTATPRLLNSTGRLVTLLTPPESETTGRGKREFSWAANFDLEPNQGFELIFWRPGQDPLADGLGFAGSSQETNVSVDCGLVTLCTFDQEYLWGVRLVRLPPDYEKLTFLGGGWKYRFESSGGSQPCSRRDSSGNCLD